MKNKLVLYLLVSLVASCIYPVTVWAKVNERFSLKNESVSSSLFRDTGSSGTLYKSCGCSGHHTAQPKSRDLFSGGRAWSEII